MKNLLTFEKYQSIIPTDQIRTVKDYVNSGCFGILSAFKDDSTFEENEDRSFELKSVLKDANYNPIKIIGQYDSDSNETSYIVEKPDSMTNEEFEDSLAEFAQDFEQESFLFSRDGDVILIFADGKIKDVSDTFKIDDTYVSFTFD
jgi:hypothetical protein